MNENQFDILKALRPGEPMLSAEMVGDRSRTLVYGYQTDRSTFHVYLADGEFHRVKYSGETLISHDHAPEMSLISLRPSKRAYPERTDFRFASLMASLGAALTFVPFADLPATADADWHGCIIGEGDTLVPIHKILENR